MSQAAEQVESRFATWVVGLVIASCVLGALTILLSMTDGMVGKAFPVGVVAFGLAVSARILAQGVNAHRPGATVALVFATIAMASGVQSLLLGTGL